MPKHNAAVAKSYAKALFELARERNQVDVVARELDTLVEVVERERQLAEFLSRPWIAAASKRGAAADVATRVGVSPLLRDFLALLAVRNRIDHVGAISRAYRALDDEAKGRVRVKLRTVVGLTEPERGALRGRLSQMLGGKDLIIEESVDPALLGGFVAEVGSMILDGSLDNQLARMRERLAKA